MPTSRRLEVIPEMYNSDQSPARYTLKLLNITNNKYTVILIICHFQINKKNQDEFDWVDQHHRLLTIETLTNTLNQHSSVAALK
jgi:hypothetical protein